MSVEYFDQPLSAPRKVHFVYLAQLFGAVIFIHIISDHDTEKPTKNKIFRYWFSDKLCTSVRRPPIIPHCSTESNHDILFGKTKPQTYDPSDFRYGAVLQ